METCPISGTIARGADPIADARQIRTLLNSTKDEVELTMYMEMWTGMTSPVISRARFGPVLGRRQVEFLFPGDPYRRPCRGPASFPVTTPWMHSYRTPGLSRSRGAPKQPFMECIERLERSPRRSLWRGCRLLYLQREHQHGNLPHPHYPALRRHGRGASRSHTWYDSVPVDEELETRTTAAAMLDVIRQASAAHEGTGSDPSPSASGEEATRPAPRVLLVDHEDSFVHTLATTTRQAGAEVTTLRSPVGQEILARHRPDLVVLSPGPGRPADYGVPTLVKLCAESGIPAFGVCLGLQGMVEAFGGKLGVLPAPVHGKPSPVTHREHSALCRDPGPIYCRTVSFRSSPSRSSSRTCWSSH